MSSHVLNICKDGDSATPQGNLFQLLITITVLGVFLPLCLSRISCILSCALFFFCFPRSPLTWVWHEFLCVLYFSHQLFIHTVKRTLCLFFRLNTHSVLSFVICSSPLIIFLVVGWLAPVNIYIYLALESPKMDTASRCVTPVVSRGERSPFFGLPSALCLMQLRRQLSSWSVPSQYCSILHFVLQTFMVFLCSCLSISSACRSLSEWVLSNLLGYKPLLTLSLVFLISMKYHNVTAIQYFLKSQKINWNCGELTKFHNYLKYITKYFLSTNNK